jgi:glucokinase
MSLLAGIDIGGTKCAVVLGRPDGDEIAPAGQGPLPTPPTFAAAMSQIANALRTCCAPAPGQPAGDRDELRAGRWTARPV